MRPNLISQ